VSADGVTWRKGQLGDYSNKRGVYIHHCHGKMLYVGKATKGDYGTFGERLRREFQFSAAGTNKKLHNLLAKQAHSIYCYFLDLDDVDAMVNPGSMTLDRETKALILEQVLIGIYKPEGNAKSRVEFPTSAEQVIPPTRP
jgi:excinuclease UvrABC nuclease subunit